MKLTIDNREIDVNEGITILEAAEANDIYIPRLCYHPQLTPHGGCRLCIVEVEGMKGYPIACTTRVQEGMEVRTRTDILREMRKEILQLILSEHPSGCLICEEAEECKGTQDTIRKVGVTTGCRWCPNDRDCELQKVVEDLEIKEIEFPVYYQDLEVEKADPFYDRDYNLCIYCARCVRICEEHRKSFVLGLHERGKDMVVGPAFHESHINAECEFCGACVSVCPTGTLFEKYRKWAGVPDDYRESICPLCSMNCEIQMAVKKGKVIGTIPPGEPHLSGGELCVKGRFCLAEMMNHADRLLEPGFRFPEGYGIISPEQAIEKAAQQLNAADGKGTAIYISPNLSLEEYAAVNRFAAQVMNTGNITSSVLNENMISFLSLAEKSVSLKDVENAGAIIPVFLKGNYHYAPLTLAIKRAAARGVPLYQVAWTTDTTSRFADRTVSPPPGKEKDFFQGIVDTLEKGKGGSTEIKELVKLLKDAPPAVFVLGPEIADLTEGADILQGIEKIAGLTGAKIFAPDPFGNITGMLSVIQCKSSEEIDKLVEEGKIHLLYLIGDVPFSKRPPVKFIIHQDSFPPPDELLADLVLPTAGWGEISGTYAGRGKVFKKFKAVVEPPGMALINQEIFTRIAGAMGKKDIKFTVEEIAGQIPQNPSIKPPGTKGKRSRKAKVSPPDSSYPYLLVQERTPQAFHSVSLSKVIPGMAELLPEDTIVLNPGDASAAGLQEGDSVYVESAGYSASYPLKLRHSISPGFVFLLTHSRTHVFDTNPCPVHLRRNNV